MDEARSIFARLRTAAWADPEADFNEVMQGLAEGHPVTVVLARERRSGTFTTWVTRMTPEEHRLSEELVALARAPYLAKPWPVTPETPLHRLEEDFARSTGRALGLSLRWDRYPSFGMWLIDITIDGVRVGGRALADHGGGPEARLVDVADKVCEGWLQEEVWGGWPMCRRHPRRPMAPHLGPAGMASWGCAVDPADTVPIGRLLA